MEPDFAALLTLLPPDRARRAAALGNTPSGRRCLAAGLLIRRVFGADAETQVTALGKPTLSDGRCFNLSHAGDYAVLAAGGAPLGVDIERIRPLDHMRIAGRFFHPDEVAFLLAQPDCARAFFRIWTLKESYSKALGDGFSLPPASYCLLPVGKRSAVFAGETPFRFCRYDEAFDGYCLSVCAMEDAFCDTVTMCGVAEIL